MATKNEKVTLKKMVVARDSYDLREDAAGNWILPPNLMKLVKISEQTIMVIDELETCGEEGITHDELHGMFHEIGGEGNFHALMRLVMETGEVEMIRQGPTTTYRLKCSVGAK